MSSLTVKDRVSLCMFTFADGRRCRTPRVRNHPHFCFDHAEKEARARATQKLGKDLAYFFSGDYLSACDLSTALGRLIPAVLRGDVKPRAARTVAYLAQTLVQAIHIGQHEYINAFGTEGWRKSIRNSVNGNQDYLFPPGPTPAPEPQPPAPSALRTNLRSESPQPTPPPTQAQPAVSQPAQTPVNLSFRAQRGTCFFFRLATRHSPLATSSSPIAPTSTPSHERRIRSASAGRSLASCVSRLDGGNRCGSTFATYPATNPSPARQRTTNTHPVHHANRSTRQPYTATLIN